MIVYESSEQLLFDEDPPVNDSLDFLRYHLFHQKPLYGNSPIYDHRTRRLERSIVTDPQVTTNQ